MRPLRSHIIIHNSGKINDFSSELQRLITPTGKKNETKQRNQSLYIFYIEKYIKITYYTIHQLIMDNEKLINKINLLEEELKKTKDQLQKYTNGNNHKTYYEKNKEIVMQKASENKKKIKETNQMNLEHLVYLTKQKNLVIIYT